MKKRLIPWLASACAGLALATGAYANGREHGHEHGVEAGDLGGLPAALSAQWWQWAFSIPAASNPVVDETGAYCMVGQRGPIWFLAGAFSGQPVTRTCTIPEGVALFFPVVNQVFINTPGCGGQDATSYSVDQMRAAIAPIMDTATGLSVRLNNRPVRILPRVQSVPFAVVLPPDGLGGDCAVGWPYWPSVDDGYYSGVAGLHAGKHHLSIKGKVLSGGAYFTIDVTYKLNVVKRHSN